MTFEEISGEKFSSLPPHVQESKKFLEMQKLKEIEEAIPLASTNESTGNAILHLIYGFIIFLAVCILFSLARAIYYYISISIGSATETTESSTNTQSPSTSDRPSISRDQELENTDMSNTERLNIQLEKLRKMLNDVNARLGVSRDTINFPTTSAQFASNPRQSSSDLDTLWSSIDFDDFESTIYDDTTRKTPTELSVSPSISYSSLDMTRSCLASSHSLNNVIFPKSSASQPTHREISNLSTPSNVITQLVELLNSFITKSENSKIPLKSRISDCKYSEKVKRTSKAIELKPLTRQSIYVPRTYQPSPCAMTNQPSTSRFLPSYNSEIIKTSLFEPIQQKQSTSKFRLANSGTAFSENESFSPDNFSDSCNPYQGVLPTVYESVEPNKPRLEMKCSNISSLSESVDFNTLSLFEVADVKTSSAEFFDVKMSSSSESEDRVFYSLDSVKEKCSHLSDSVQPIKALIKPASVIKKLPICISESVFNTMASPASNLKIMRRSFSETQLLLKNNMLFLDSTDIQQPMTSFQRTNISSSESTLSDTPSESLNLVRSNYWNFLNSNTQESCETKGDRLLQSTSESLKRVLPIYNQNILPSLSIRHKSMKSEITLPEFLSPEIGLSSTPFSHETPNNALYSTNETNWSTPLEHESHLMTHVTNETCKSSSYLLNSNAWSTPPAP